MQGDRLHFIFSIIRSEYKSDIFFILRYGFHRRRFEYKFYHYYYGIN